MIRLNINKRSSARVKKRLKSKAIIRKKIFGSQTRPRLVVFRSHKHIYAQIVDDSVQKTLVQSSSLKGADVKKGCEQALKIGEDVAKQAISKGIKSIVFDRNGYVYHGRIKSVAEGARKAGLVF